MFFLQKPFPTLSSFEIWDGSIHADAFDESRKLTIAANGTYTKQLSRNLFENIVQDEIYLKVITDQDISLQIRLTEEAAGASCE